MVCVLMTTALCACKNEKEPTPEPVYELGTEELGIQNLTKYIKQKYDFDVEFKEVYFLNKVFVDENGNYESQENTKYLSARFIAPNGQDCYCVTDTMQRGTEACYDDYEVWNVCMDINNLITEHYPSGNYSHSTMIYPKFMEEDGFAKNMVLHKKYSGNIVEFLTSDIILAEQHIELDILLYAAKDVKTPVEALKPLLDKAYRVSVINCSKNEMIDNGLKFSKENISELIGDIAEYNVFGTQMRNSELYGYHKGNGSAAEYKGLGMLD